MPAIISSIVASPGSRFRFAIRSIGGRFQPSAREFDVPGSPARACEIAPPSGRSRMPLRIRWTFSAFVPVVVPAVARELLGARRIERDVEQLRPVAIRAEHVGRDEARAGEVALVAEDAVELERVADRLVDLQDHLVGREQHVHRPVGAVRRGEELERFLGDPTRAALEPEAREDLVAALLADAAVAVERSGLRVAICMRGHRHARQQEPVALGQVAAFAGDEAMHRRGATPCSLPNRRSSRRSPRRGDSAISSSNHSRRERDRAPSDGDA